MNNIIIVRHGDVLCRQITSLPDNAVEKKDWDGVVMHGETGHRHRFADPTHVRFMEADGKIYMHVEQESVITHEEHKPIAIPPAFYEVYIEEEYSPFDKVMRQVKD